MHLLFLDTWLPFSVTRYPIVRAPYLEYTDSSWRNYTNEQVSRLSVDKGGYVLVEFSNPTRLHSLKEDVMCSIFKENVFVSILNITKSVQVPPNTYGQYTFPFILSEPGNYTYRIVSEDRVLTDSSQIILVE